MESGALHGGCPGAPHSAGAGAQPPRRRPSPQSSSRAYARGTLTPIRGVALLRRRDLSRLSRPFRAFAIQRPAVLRIAAIQRLRAHLRRPRTPRPLTLTLAPGYWGPGYRGEGTGAAAPAGPFAPVVVVSVLARDLDSHPRRRPTSAARPFAPFAPFRAFAIQRPTLFTRRALSRPIRYSGSPRSRPPCPDNPQPLPRVFPPPRLRL